ncbi:MAG: hypothetical protein M0R49_06865 [Limnochordia bacterium]|jgi:hypothetical protein|nr:hypothetical protein [Limnochordia bacterium]
MNARAWLFRGLILIAAGLMILSWFMPWWIAEVVILEDANVMIHPWGLSNTLDFFEVYIEGANMPGWFPYLMFAYLGIAVLALLASMFLKDKVVKILKFKFTLPQLVILIVGISYIVVGVGAAVFAAIRTGDFWGMHLLGKTLIVINDLESDVVARFLPGYYLVYLSGIFMIILALLRNKITGNAASAK